MKILLSDGASKEVQDDISVIDLAGLISDGLRRATLAANVNGEVVDLRTILKEGDRVEILTFESEDGKHALFHSGSHLLAHAVKRLYPGAKLAIGPAIADGFYYDIDFEAPIAQSDLDAIETEMKKIQKEALPITRFSLPRAEAIAFVKEAGESYKEELIAKLPEDAEISFYSQGDFTDLCAGPHVATTKQLVAFKLTSLAGAYWQGDSNNKMLTRIYGTVFPKKEMLKEHLNRIEEAKKRDHRKLGKEQKLFVFNEAGPGFPFWLPNGMILKNTLVEHWRKLHIEHGYQEIGTPMILNGDLWKQSGHWDHYRDNMYMTKIDEGDFAVKPMNCPGAMLVYKSQAHSYRDFPLRMAELGLVHRHEKSGVLHGLMRVRCFTQDDAHIYMTPEQITPEIKRVIKLIDKLYGLFNFSYTVELSTRPDDCMGTVEEWDQATDALRQALDELKLPYQINEGDGAFYGPKIDFHIKDSIGRTWQCGTIQLDFQMPQRFDIHYIGQDGEKHRPIMIHRAALGSLERFIGVLTEHCAGKFPVWLSPVQARIVPISAEHHQDYAKEVEAALVAQGLRVEVDGRSEKVGLKIREAQLEKVPFTLVVGDSESQTGAVSVRRLGSQETTVMPLAEFVALIKEEIDTYKWSA